MRDLLLVLPVVPYALGWAFQSHLPQGYSAVYHAVARYYAGFQTPGAAATQRTEACDGSSINLGTSQAESAADTISIDSLDLGEDDCKQSVTSGNKSSRGAALAQNRFGEISSKRYEALLYDGLDDPAPTKVKRLDKGWSLGQLQSHLQQALNKPSAASHRVAYRDPDEGIVAQFRDTDDLKEVLQALRHVGSPKVLPRFYLVSSQDAGAVRNSWSRTLNLKFAVSVSSRIGKSMWGYLLLYHWACGISKGEQIQRIVVRKKSWQREQPHLFCAEGAFVLTEDQFEDELLRPDVMYLIDGLKPDDYALPGVGGAKMLLISSNQEDRHQQVFSKRDWHKKLYMDGWSKAEMCLARDLLELNISDSELQERINTWGELNACNILRDDRRSPQEMDAAIRATLLPNFNNLAAGNSARFTGPSEVYFMRARRDLETTYVVYSSIYITWRIYQAALKQRRYDVTTYLSLLGAGEEELRELARFRGTGREPLARMIIHDGGEFTGRCLTGVDEGKVYTLQLPQSPFAAAFTDIREVVDALDGVYYQSADSDYPGIDALRQPELVISKQTEAAVMFEHISANVTCHDNG
ncbi:hypothetical protein JKP88DRAFT_303719 [Tribonema minus]|uniref:Uncharacterized protein n=1 Tax=Tribonema minus TaxID=303371 RepID=A0A836CKI5_9STRA|nr:hypothetical protein JKP88DRAFT_303719 [Tribonema minus]